MRQRQLRQWSIAFVCASLALAACAQGSGDGVPGQRADAKISTGPDSNTSGNPDGPTDLTPDATPGTPDAFSTPDADESTPDANDSQIFCTSSSQCASPLCCGDLGGGTLGVCTLNIPGLINCLP